MKYQFELDEITNCGDCPCCDTISGCRLGELEERFDKIPVDCPLAIIPQTDTTRAIQTLEEYELSVSYESSLSTAKAEQIKEDLALAIKVLKEENK